jgi:hypothetical protein
MYFDVGVLAAQCTIDSGKLSAKGNLYRQSQKECTNMVFFRTAMHLSKYSQTILILYETQEAGISESPVPYGQTFDSTATRYN